MSQRHGVSLVELLVVVGLLALFTATLVSSAATVSQQSKEQTCMNRLARLGYASFIYAAEDPDQLIIPVHRLHEFEDVNNPTFIGAYEWGGKSGVGRVGYTEGPSVGPEAFISSRYGSRAGFGPGTRPLNRILYGDIPDNSDNPGPDNTNWVAETVLDLPEMRCPADSGPPAGGHCPDWLAQRHLTSYDYFGTSYNANVLQLNVGIGLRAQSNSPYLRPLREVPNPSETVLFQENNGRWAWVAREPQACQWIGEGGFPEGAIRGWHGKDWTFSAAFVDGHVESIYMNSFTQERISIEDQVQTQFRCSVVRGPGWRLDTLPAKLIPLSYNYPFGARAALENCVIEE